MLCPFSILSFPFYALIHQGEGWPLREKMKSLMDVCRNWGAKGCHPDISKWKSVAEIEEGNEIPVRPNRGKLNKICRNCKVLSLKECPSCNSTYFFMKSGIEIKGKKKKIEELSFYCDNCKVNFIIIRQI